MLELVEYEISDEPMESPYYAHVPPEDRERMDAIAERAMYHELRGDDIEELEQLIRQYPNVAPLYNYLANVYLASDRLADAERLVRETYRRFPDYLFAAICYANLRIHEGYPWEVPGILRGRMTLHQFLGRKRAHETEAIGFFGMMAQYFLAIGEIDRAMRSLATLEEIAPDHPQVRQIKAFFKSSALADAFRGALRSLHLIAQDEEPTVQPWLHYR